MPDVLPPDPAPNPGRPVLKAGFLLAIAYLGFISLGLPDPVAGVAWPTVRDTFGLPQSSFGLVFIALGFGYCASGFFGGKLTHALKLGNLLWLSSGLVALAMLVSGSAPGWAVFVACAFFWGLGSGGIDAGLNAYVSSHFSARHVNWLHACYSLGATVGPLLMTAVLVQSGSWRTGYWLIGGLLLAMTALFLVTRTHWIAPTHTSAGAAVQAVGIRQTLRERLVWLQIALFFVYVGLEFTVGQWCFTLLTEARGVRADLAGVLAGSYYGAIGVGRVVAGVVAHRLGLDRLIRLATVVALGGTIAFALSRSPGVAALGLAAIGLGMAPIFPSMMARTPERLGPALTTHAVGFQVSAGMLGAALVPAGAGLLIENVGLESLAQFSVGLAVLLLAIHEFLVAATPATSQSRRPA